MYKHDVVVVAIDGAVSHHQYQINVNNADYAAKDVGNFVWHTHKTNWLHHFDNNF